MNQKWTLALGIAISVVVYALFHNGWTFTALALVPVIPLVLVALSTKKRGWWLLAIGQLLFAIGDAVAYNHKFFFGEELLDFPSHPDIFYVAVYPFMLVGVMCLIDWDREVTRAAAIIFGVGLLAYFSSLFGYLSESWGFDAWLAVFYVTMDMVLMSLITGVLVMRKTHLSGWLLAVGFAVLLVTDSLYAYGNIVGGGYFTGGSLDYGWLIYYGLLAGAGLAALKESKDVS